MYHSPKSSSARTKASGARPLTWQQAIAVVAFIPALICGIVALSPPIGNDPARGVFRIVFAASTLVFFACTVLHFRRVWRVDVYPDVLADLVNPEVILQLGRCHLHIDAEGYPGGVEIRGIVQNLTDADATLLLKFEPPYSQISRGFSLPELFCEVPAAAVVQVSRRIDLPSIRPAQYKMYLEGHFHSKGREIRFARRRAVTRGVHPLLTLGMLLAGSFHAGGGTYIAFTTQSLGQTSDPPPPGDEEWQVQLVWSPESQSIAGQGKR